MHVIKFFDESPITFNDGGFFNATQAAAVFGKLPAEWARLPSTVEYMTELEKSDVGLSHIALIATKKGGKVGTQGTWMHPKLAVLFARWLDVRFAVWCDGQIEQIIRSAGAAKAEREHARLECPGMTLALKETRAGQGKDTPAHCYSNEMDMLNRLVLGMSAKQYREAHGIDPAQPLRDALAGMPAHIAAIRDLQRTNQALIECGMEFGERKERLRALMMRKHNPALTAEIHRLEA